MVKKENLRFYKGDKCFKCDKPVTIKNKSGYCQSCRMLGNKNTLGHTMSENQRIKLSLIKQGKNNPNWKGDGVGISALHAWVKRHLKKSPLCDKCGLVKPY